MSLQGDVMSSAAESDRSLGHVLRLFTIGLIAFLTLVDLFATQAILPSLVRAYGVTPAAMGFAVNASTMGMAAAGLIVALFSRKLPRRFGVMLSLALLAIPTALLATAPGLQTFTILRVIQGLFMSTAFTLTLAYLAEHGSGRETAAALAAYVTGNVASNLFGRWMSTAFVDHLGLSTNFYLFAVLNLLGAVIAFVALSRATPMQGSTSAPSPSASWRAHLGNPPLLAAFGIGFCILFAFIGTFTYVNFVLTRPPFSIGMTQLGYVYFVFAPSILTTPLAGAAVARAGTRVAFGSALAIAGLGLPLLLIPHLPVVLLGLALVAIGTFFAQAIATGFVGRAATADRGTAGGIYLACYFLGGLVGSVVLGQAFDRFGWAACVAGVGAGLGMAAALAFALRLPDEAPSARTESFR
jgi:MFS transporter, YNFM family, putative membrane transport protein